jgi:uncharacterized protein with PIN domain
MQVNKSDIVNELRDNTRKAFQEFYQCMDCRRIYWKGSHYDRMQKMVAELFEF